MVVYETVEEIMTLHNTETTTLLESCRPRRYFSVIVGAGCNARCPFCIASEVMKNGAEDFPVEKFAQAVSYALEQGSEVASVSGGGEPLLLALRQPQVFQQISEHLACHFSKRDLHSNYSIDLSLRQVDLFPAYSDVTVSLLPTASLNQEYMGYSRFQQSVNLVQRDQRRANFRLSAILGKDWIRNVDDVISYVRWAKTLGVSSVTLRTLQKPRHQEASTDWINERFLDGREVDRWLEARFSQERAILRDTALYAIEGVSVCCYRYARETEQASDQDFLFFRPHTEEGRYGLFTEYDLDESEIIL
jgi:molybdenum cofactor biosynthesis enzyme MoaA